MLQISIRLELKFVTNIINNKKNNKIKIIFQHVMCESKYNEKQKKQT